MQMNSGDNCKNQSINKLTGKFLSTVWCKKKRQCNKQLCYQQQHNNTYTFVTVVQFKMRSPHFHFHYHFHYQSQSVIASCWRILLEACTSTICLGWQWWLTVIINCRDRAVQLYSQSSSSSQRGVLKKRTVSVGQLQSANSAVVVVVVEIKLLITILFLSRLFSLGIAVAVVSKLLTVITCQWWWWLW